MIAEAKALKDDEGSGSSMSFLTSWADFGPGFTDTPGAKQDDDRDRDSDSDRDSGGESEDRDSDD